MNTIKNIKMITVWAILLGLSACNDGFMDRTPVNDLNNAAFWKSENDMKVYNNGIYNEVATNNYPFFRGNATGASESKYLSFMGMEAVSDNFASTDVNLQVWANIAAGKEVIPANAATTTGNSWRWGFLYRCNFFLDNYEKATSVSAEIRNQYAGEVYFWRAWFYFDKVQEYGNVPLITHSLNDESPELYTKQNSREEVMDAVLADIDKAIGFLPDNWASTHPDRVNTWTAQTLKSRICLYEGTWRKYHGLSDYQRFLTAAADAAGAVISSGKYTVHDTGNPDSDYRALFTSFDLHNNTEVILPKLYAIPGRGHAVTANLGGSAALFAGATKDFVDDFLCIEEDNTAKPVALSATYNDDAIENIFENRDPRLGQTILDPRRESEMYGTTGSNFPHLNGMPQTWKSPTGYHYVKNFNPVEAGIQNSQEVTDFPVLRYAEVLLNYAEAKAESGNITQVDLDKSVNKLRDRVDMPHLDLNPPMDPKYAGEGISALLVEIRRERRIELSFENSRYHDLMRWKKGAYLAKPVLGMRLEDADKAQGGRYAGATCVTVEINGKKYIDAFAGSPLSSRSFDENKNYLHPVPINIRAKNPNLEQTPGWTE
ncbi:MAG: RagB/SusD family nutrient uptake outer membrane protein [Dysgonamonadaceae bacterium]|jgi:hypothetical protein|nr:RagB/SusD family nutrient uptake outer membrane protein [Dysgonamonadaceae bacterium]